MNNAKDFLMLRFYTKIHEACDWDDKLAEECISLLGYELSVAQKKGAKSAANMMHVVRSSLLQTYEKKVVDVMVEVLQESIESAPLLMMPNVNNPVWEN